MQNIRHLTSLSSISARKWQIVANISLVAAAFLFVGAVTLGLFP